MQRGVYSTIEVAAIILIVTALAIATGVRNNTWADALTLWQDVVSLSDGKARAHSNISGAYYELGRLKLSLAETRKALDVDPLHAEAYNNLGVIYLEYKSYAEAIAAFRRAIELRYLFKRAHYNLAVALRESGDTRAAAESAREAIKMDAFYPRAHNELGLYYLNATAELDKAIVEFNLAIKYDPTLAEAYNNRGVVYANRGDLNAALIEFERALKLEPELSDAYSNAERARSDLSSRE